MRRQLQETRYLLSETDCSIRVMAASLPIADAIGQLRGIMIGAKMDVTEDVKGRNGVGRVTINQQRVPSRP